MTSLVEVVRAQSSDARAIADLFAGSIDPNFVKLVPFGCVGAAEFIRRELSVPNSLSGSLYLVARERKVVIGAAEMRRSPNSLFLNNIAVCAKYRGKGTGAALLTAGIAVSDQKSGSIGLDSLEGNERVEEWYRQLGFVTQECTEFAEVCPPDQEADHSVWLSGLPQADLTQRQFGFSSFTVHSASSGPVSVGRIGSSWFRLTDPQTIRDPAIFRALQAFDPNRRFLAVLPASSLPPEQRLRVFATLRRMEAAIPQVLERLAERNAKPEHRIAAIIS